MLQVIHIDLAFVFTFRETIDQEQACFENNEFFDIQQR